MDAVAQPRAGLPGRIDWHEPHHQDIHTTSSTILFNIKKYLINYTDGYRVYIRITVVL